MQEIFHTNVNPALTALQLRVISRWHSAQRRTKTETMLTAPDSGARKRKVGNAMPLEERPGVCLAARRDVAVRSDVR